MKKKITEDRQREAWFDAIRDNDIKTVKEMIKEGVDVNIKDHKRWTALYIASYWGNIDIANLLINNGADVNAKDDTERIPLHLACDWGYIEIAKLLIDKGANLTAKDNDGNTPLDDLKTNMPKRYEELLQWLADNYADKMLEYMATESVQGRGVEL